eukprot:scaffold3801_cov150-Skeletonema_menzelii.AAC.2
MSEDNETDTCCASCGIAEIDDVKLKGCDDCDLVRYCSDACQQNRKSQHEEDCKKRAAELRDELLFKQPESRHDDECSICCLPLSLDVKKSGMYMCCSKIICGGCVYANEIREDDASMVRSCPFCREAVCNTKEGRDRQNKERAVANDPVALREEGIIKREMGDCSVAFEYFTKAAELGDTGSHHQLSCMYHGGEGVEKDERKKIYHAEEAAIGGHTEARYNLGMYEGCKGNYERAVKHFIISAKQGHDGSMKFLMKAFKEGDVSKEELAAALRAHQAAVNATKSPQRDAAP